MPATHRTHRVTLGVLACGLCLLSRTVGAEVTISGIEADGQPLPVQVPASDAAQGTKPLRISSAARSVRFQFTAGDVAERPAVRLRYKLEGYDETWRDLPTRMRMLVLFYDRDGQGVGSHEFYLEGETPGWRAQVEDAQFVPRREQCPVPEKSAAAQISFLSHGGEAGLGVIGVDAVRVLVERPGVERAAVFDQSITQGADLSHPLGTPANWMRAGSRAELAQLRTRPTPTPHPILVLEDDDPRNYGNWSTAAKHAIPIRPGDRLTIEWQTAHSIGSSGPGQADYPRLKPGSYWFRVAAVKINGEPTGQEVSLPLEVVVPVYFRLEFWLVLAAIAGGSTAWLGRVALQRRMRRQIARMEQEHALERERARIARDLHDDIGAGLTEIAMQSDWVRRDLLQGPTADTQRRIERVCQSAVDLVRNVDEIVWAVNPAHDTLKRFVNYLVQYTEQTLDAAGLSVRFDVPADFPDAPLAGTLRHYLFLAVREALNNATRHAHADVVRLEMHMDAAALQIAIEDNGCGFVPDQVEAGDTREGLGNMRRRMEDLGGQFRLTSRPGSGTRVEFRVPLPNSGRDVREGA